MEDFYAFGYPQACARCAISESGPGPKLIGLNVEPYLKPGSTLRIMLVGQDPTIARRPDRVHRVLMLDQPHGQLARWLTDVIGQQSFDLATIYATNVVKCSFTRPPSSAPERARKFLEPYFELCRDYIQQEVMSFRPQCVLSLGEPTHQFFVSLLDNREEFGANMKTAFTGRFARARLRGFEFDYSPCLHIQTFRVAETYGTRVDSFKRGLRSYFGRTG